MKRSSGRRPKRGAAPPTVIILGPQGSGKGTQATILAERFHLAHIETGAILRSFAKKKRQTAFTKAVARHIDNGRLIPSPWMLRIIREHIARVPRSRGIIFDGSPRRLGEAKRLVAMLRQSHRTVSMVIFLTIPKSATIRRLSRRWLCVRHNHLLIMGKDVRTPHDPCPRCGAAIYQRADDTPVAIRKRLDIYSRETRPVIEYFWATNHLVTVDGNRSVAAVARTIRQLLERTLQA